MAAQLKISDGTTEISLIDIGPGIHLNDWTPVIAQYKGGGVFRSNPQATGRQLIQKTFGNAIETFDLKVNNLNRNALIFKTQDLVRLLEKATDYWTSDWQNTVVYLIAQAECEDNPRYAEIVSYSIPQLDNPYSQPFLSIDGNAVFDSISLAVERKHWKDNIPGNGTAIAISGTQNFDGRALGRLATSSEEEVFVSSKHNVANLTDIYIDDGGVFGSNLMDAALPYSLLPAAPAVNDAIYFGIDTSVADSGPFSSLAFDIGTALVGTLTIIWEYSDGGAGWPTLTTATAGVGTGTAPFTSAGVHLTVWEQPSAWVAEAVNGITAFWIRARVSAFTSTSAIPTQQNRDIYSAVLGYVNIDSGQVLGDIPALVIEKIAQDTIGGAGGLIVGTAISRVITGLRSVSRGSVFTAYFNCSDEQEPNSAYSASVGTNSSFADDLTTATGRRVTFNPPATRIPFETVVTFDIETNQTNFFGTYRAFLRCRQVGGNLGDIDIRISVYSTGGSIVGTNFIAQSTTLSPLVIDDWQLLDMGQLSFPPRGILNSTDEFVNFNIIIEADNFVGAAPDVYFADMVLMPVDEWAGDFFQDKGVVGFPSLIPWGSLDIDSIEYPKLPTRILLRGFRNDTESGNIYDIPQAIYNGDSILQANASQRLWYLFANFLGVAGTHTGANNQATLTDAAADFINQGVEAGLVIQNTTDGSHATITGVTVTTITGALLGGTGNDWDTNDAYLIVTDKWISKIEMAASVTIQTNNRYLGMRGNR